jgi:hypothetical protein
VVWANNGRPAKIEIETWRMFMLTLCRNDLDMRHALRVRF